MGPEQGKLQALPCNPAQIAITSITSEEACPQRNLKSDKIVRIMAKAEMCTWHHKTTCTEPWACHLPGNFVHVKCLGQTPNIIMNNGHDHPKLGTENNGKKQGEKRGTGKTQLLQVLVPVLPSEGNLLGKASKVLCSRSYSRRQNGQASTTIENQ